MERQTETGTKQTLLDEARAIQRYTAPSAGRGASVQLLEHCDGEWACYEDHATALSSLRQEIAAKDVEREKAVTSANDLHNETIAELKRQLAVSDRLRETAEAQLAEARKALEHIEAAAKDKSEKAWYRLETIADEAHFAREQGGWS